MTLAELKKNKELSVRSYNVCRSNDLVTIEHVIRYYEQYRTFENLRNCGRRSNEELISICLNNEYYNINSNMTNLETNKVDPFVEIIQSLSRTQRDVINSFIKVNIHNLSNRGKNALSKFLNNNYSIRNFSDKIFLDISFRINEIENVGGKTTIEIEKIINNIREYIIHIYKNVGDKELLTVKNRFLIQHQFSINEIPFEILKSSSIFQLTDFLLKKNVFFNENHNLIIQKAIKMYRSIEENFEYEIIDNVIIEKDVKITYNIKEYTLEEIAEIHNLSKERVRQIRKDCINELFEKLSFIRNFNDDLFQNYGIDLSSYLIEVQESLADQINEMNRTNFSKEFISYILGVYLSNDFVIIGNMEDVLLPKFSSSRNRHNWNNFYIVSKEFSEVDFISLTNDISERLSERIEETYSFNFKSYISRFVNSIDIELIEKLFFVVEKIINDEFSLNLDIDDNIVFYRNTYKQSYEYAIEALGLLGEPSKVEDITRKIIEIHPNYETDEKKVRASMKRIHGFVPIGRASVFGLKKWENELDDFKGGTIKDIVIAYLDKNENPIHIYEILEEIHKYREETNAKNVITNLKLDPQKQFKIFNQSFIGLNKKDYDSNLTDLPKFLGKNITNYIRQNHSVNIHFLNKYYSNFLDISHENMNNIVNQLIDSDFIHIDEQNMLTV